MPEDPDESFVIRTLTAHAGIRPSPALAVGPGDDAAVLDSGLVVTVDAMVEGVHWDSKLSAEDVGWKLVMVNASDIGAMGARPRYALLALSLPPPISAAWVEGFARGLHGALTEVGASLIGGDTTASVGSTVASLTMFGQLDTPPLRRSGARPGDRVWVSGTLGDAAGGFLLDAPPDALRAALRRPRPPLALGPALSGLASAAMDLSDGLATDLARLCAASGCGAIVQPAALPISASLAACSADPVPLAVGFGEDYGLLFTAPPDASEAIELLAAQLGLQVTDIGRCTADGAVRLAGRPWPRAWQHFSPGGPL